MLLNLSLNYFGTNILLAKRCGIGGIDVGEEMLLVALGCGRLAGIFAITTKHPFVVFGTMDGKVLAGLTACVVGNTVSAFPVYFYETG